MLLRNHGLRVEKLSVNIETISCDRVGQQDLVAKIMGSSEATVGQLMPYWHHEHLLVIKHGHETQAAVINRVGRHQQVDFVILQRIDAAKLELLPDIHVHPGPTG